MKSIMIHALCLQIIIQHTIANICTVHAKCFDEGGKRVGEI